MTEAYTSEDYKVAAQGQLFFAKMTRLQGNTDAADAHYDLADLYIKQELRKATRKNS